MQYSQEHLKTMVYAKFGGQTECIMGNWKIENCLFFFSATFKLFFRHSFYHFFSLRKNKIKNGIHADYVTQKLKWKFDIRDSWLVTFLVREQCQRTRHVCDPLRSDWLPERA